MERGLEFGILGPVEVRLAGQLVEVPGASQRVLLARLLLDADRLISREQLLADLWVSPPSTGLSALYQRIAQLRQALEQAGAGRDVVQTRGTGYIIELGAHRLDLHRFEDAAGDADEALAAGRHADAAASLREALELWRGSPLAEFPEAPFAAAAGARLEESRLAALEKRLDADLALGHHLNVVGELEALAAEHPFREGFTAKLMLALYRAGRQADALEAYQDVRQVLVEELGVEPTAELQHLERAILQQDPTLVTPVEEDASAAEHDVRPDSPARSILVVPDNRSNLEQLVALGEPLTRRPPRELILTAIAAAGDQLAEMSALLERERAALVARRIPARAAAFTSEARGADIVRFASEQDVDVLLTDASARMLADGTLSADLELVLRESSCHVAVVVGGEQRDSESANAEVVLPFGGTEHDWAALDLSARFAASRGAPLTLLGSEARPEAGKRDASRLLARASMIAQRSSGVAAAPKLIPPGEEAILAASRSAGLLVVGLSERWADEGLGAARLALAQDAHPPMLIVRCAFGAHGMAAQDEFTRYTWSRAENS